MGSIYMCVCLLYTSVPATILHTFVSEHFIVCVCVSKHACGKDKGIKTHMINIIHSVSLHGGRCVSDCGIKCLPLCLYISACVS